MNTTAEQGRVFVRDCSCYCIGCITGAEGTCNNKERLEDWREIKIERDSTVATTRQAVDTMEATLRDTAAVDTFLGGSVVLKGHFFNKEGNKRY